MAAPSWIQLNPVGYGLLMNFSVSQLNHSIVSDQTAHGHRFGRLHALWFASRKPQGLGRYDGLKIELMSWLFQEFFSFLLDLKWDDVI